MQKITAICRRVCLRRMLESVYFSSVALCSFKINTEYRICPIFVFRIKFCGIATSAYGILSLLKPQAEESYRTFGNGRVIFEQMPLSKQHIQLTKTIFIVRVIAG